MNTNTTAPASSWVECDHCGGVHVAEYSHEGRFSEGALYAVVCPVDGLTDWYTAERFVPAPVEGATRPADLDLSRRADLS